jgi:outer membrane protein assembly factor BamB
MNDLDRQNARPENDEQIQITDLDPEGSHQQRRAGKIIIILRRSITIPWLRYGLPGLLLIILLGSVFLQTYGKALPTRIPISTTTTASPPDFLNAISANDRVYIQTNDGTVTTYQSENGQMLWRNKLPGQAQLLATSQALYCYTIMGNQGLLEALSLQDGRSIWSRTLPVPGSDALLQSDDALYAGTGNDMIYAFQASNGHLRWTYQYAPPNVPAAPISTILSVQGKIAEIAFSDTTVHILWASTGQEIMHLPVNSSIDGDPFLPVDGQLIYSFRNFDASGLVSGEGDIQVFHLSDSTPLWELQIPAGDWARAPVEQAGVIYFSNADGSLTALRGIDGDELWTYAGPIARAPVEENGLLYTFMEDGSLVCLGVSNGQRIWNTQITQLAQFPETIQPFDNGIIFLSQQTILGGVLGYVMYAVHASDGKILWHIFDPPGALTVQSGTIYIIQDNGEIDAWRESDDKHLWSYRSLVTPALLWSSDDNQGLAFLLNIQDGMDVLRISDGKVLWHYSPKL